MDSDSSIQIEVRLRRLENQNRILLIGIGVLIGALSVAATNSVSSLITASEVRTAHLTLVDNHGKLLVETQGINGVEVRSYLPHEVVQR